MADRASFTFESFQDAQTIRAFLENLTEGIASGRISLTSGEERIELSPGGLLYFQVKARKKKDEGRISLKIAWKDPSPSGIGAITISPG
jgi:amphi-Trp domain-containing protein